MTTPQEMRNLIKLVESGFTLDTAQHIVSDYIADCYDIDASELVTRGQHGGIAWTLADDDGGEGETVTIEATDTKGGVALSVTPSNPGRTEITLPTTICASPEQFNTTLEKALSQH